MAVTGDMYQCPTCGGWFGPGQYHTCPGNQHIWIWRDPVYDPPTPAPLILPPPDLSKLEDKLDRIIEKLEVIDRILNDLGVMQHDDRQNWGVRASNYGWDMRPMPRMDKAGDGSQL